MKLHFSGEVLFSQEGGRALCVLFLAPRLVHPKQVLVINLFVGPLRSIYLFVTATHQVALQPIGVDGYFESREIG